MKLKIVLLAFSTYLLSGCAAELQWQSSPSSSSNSEISNQNDLSQSISGTYITFKDKDYYSLSSPNATNCAGDANTFYYPLTQDPNTLGALALPQSLIDSTTTIRPSFIKNISVDITDSNANIPSNKALSCSFGSGPSSPAVSNCASFDSGTMDGIPSNLGGTLLLLGGLESINYSGGFSLTCGPTSPLSLGQTSNVCSSKMLSMSTTSNQVSWQAAWMDLSSTTGYSGPTQMAGSSASYNETLKKLLIFGGATVLSAAMNAPAGGAITYDTWTFDMKSQKWTKISENTAVNPFLTNMSDTSLNFNKNPGGRALFGYTALSGSAIAQLSLNGQVTGTGGAQVDTTDRIFIVGGYGVCPNGVCTDVHRFNPTYGPEYFDTQASVSPNQPALLTKFPSQWIDSYHTQILSNSLTLSQLIPMGFPSPTPYPSPSPTVSPIAYLSQISFGMVGLNNNFPISSGGSGLGVSSLSPFTSDPAHTAGAGYLLSAGGFYGLSGISGNTNTPNGSTCTSINQCGGMQIALKWFGTTWNESNELYSSNFSSVSNFINTTQSTPIQWKSITDGSGNATTPWYGGGVILSGINIPITAPSFAFPSPQPPHSPTTIPPEATNQVVFFGGSDCRNYLTDANANCPNWNLSATTPIGNPGRYWVFGIDPAYTFSGGSSTPTVVNMAGTIPMNAGMAAARGVDSQNNPVIVSWGGMTNPARVDTTGIIYYLYYNTTNQAPTWASAIPIVAGPAGLGNAALVFSHVTKKFYLFGGYSPLLGTVFDTWELTLSSITPGTSCGVSATPNCQFAWRPLSPANGMTCYPGCPPARRSHRMVEANYHYFNAPFEPSCSSASHPCSFGIFMEGGTSNGLPPYLGDRWMFDPTANGGSGHWQDMGELPPRTLAATASLDYIPIESNTQQSVHRVILFGGETGLQNAPNYFVPPTLGDTWMYDFQSASWNRVYLYGHRYDLSTTAFNDPNTRETEARSSSFVNDLTTTQFSPPPLSGSIMVVRTLSKIDHQASTLGTPLKIPEVFLFGGRKKDGKYLTLKSVYKFCSGSTGEKPFPHSLKGTGTVAPDDASCDANDPISNLLSYSPTTSYVGRWLAKLALGTGALDPDQVASYLGTGAYDSIHDLIVLYGGLTPNTTPFTDTAVTDSQNRTTNSYILEYTPPSAVNVPPLSAQYNGYWTQIPSCPQSKEVPVGRYGHSMGFDPIQKSLVITGGYSIDGNLLTQTLTNSNGTTSTMPETWIAQRQDQIPCYLWSRVTSLSPSSSNSSNTPPGTGLAHSASIYIPDSGYDSRYYTTFDASCMGSGPISSSDPTTSKLLVGAAYFDIDRSSLGKNENLILNLTFLPLGTQSTAPNGAVITSDQTAIFKIHLVKTGESGDLLRQRVQPRSFTYSAIDQYPTLARDLSIPGPPYGQIRQEQVFIPIAIDPGIDRIEIERYSGSAILIDASLFKTGQK